MDRFIIEFSSEWKYLNCLFWLGICKLKKVFKILFNVIVGIFIIILEKYGIELVVLKIFVISFFIIFWKGLNVLGIMFKLLKFYFVLKIFEIMRGSFSVVYSLL